MKPRHRKLALIGIALLGLGGATALVLNAFRQNMVFFFSPTEVASKVAPIQKTFRVGGLVQEGSIKRGDDGLTVRFVVTDLANSLPVVYNGVLPDLFKEGKGVVAQGRLAQDGVFHADEVLAKHDENYMPPEAAGALKPNQTFNEKAGETLQK